MNSNLSDFTDRLSPLPRKLQIGDTIEFNPTHLVLAPCDDDLWTKRAAGELAEFIGARSAVTPPVVMNAPAEAKAVIRLSATTQQNSEFDHPFFAGNRTVGYQAYRIGTLTSERGLVLQGLQPEGVYWGMKTLKQLLRFDDGKIVLPRVMILDGADMEERGIWTGFWPRPHEEVDAVLGHYREWMDWMSDHKLNLMEVSAVTERIYFKSKSHPEFNNDDTEQREFLLRQLFAYGKERGLRMMPNIVHSEGLGFIAEKHPELAGRHVVRHHGQEIGIPLNFFHPKTKAILLDLARELVELCPLDCICCWLSENRLHVLPPEEQTKSEFLQEAQTFCEIWQTLRADDPRLQLKILQTQGSFPENLALMRSLPKEVKWIFYSGERTGTYNIRARNPIHPDIATAAREGHWISLCNAIRGVAARPTVMAVLHKNLGHAIEAGIKGVDGMSYSFPGDAMASFVVAEHAWNWPGRSLDETFYAYAVSAGARDPRTQANAYRLFDQANRTQALRNCTGVGQPFGLFSRYFNFLERIKSNAGVDEMIMHIADAMEDDELPALVQAVQDCEQALALADPTADELFVLRCRYLLPTLRATHSIARAFYINCREKSRDLTKGDWTDFRAELRRLFADIVHQADESAPIYAQLLQLEKWGTVFLRQPDPLRKAAEFTRTIIVADVRSSRDL